MGLSMTSDLRQDEAGETPIDASNEGAAFPPDSAAADSSGAASPADPTEEHIAAYEAAAAAELGAEAKTAQNSETNTSQSGLDEAAGRLLRDETVESLIKTYVIAAMALAMVPVPLFDMVAVMAVQVRLVQKLTKIYGVDFNQELTRSLLLGLIGGILPATATAAALSMMQVLPGLGIVLGVAGTSLTSGAMTYAVGRIFVHHFETGGALETFDAKSARATFREEMRKGRDIAKALTAAAARVKRTQSA